MAKKIIISIISFLMIACLIGLVVTGAKVGWGPFAFIKYNKEPTLLSTTEYKYSTEETWLKNGEKSIYGTLYKADTQSEKQPIAILSHGYNGSSEYNKYIAESLAMSGISVYAYDFCGGGTKCKSDGEPVDMSIITEKSDLNAVIDQVKAWDWVDNDNIFLIGESQGGCVSALTAAERTDINSIVLYFPAFSIIEGANQQFKSADDIPDTSKAFMGMTIGKKYYEDILGIDIYKEISKFENPVLLMHGTADKTVDCSYSEKANQVYKNSELIKFENAGHGFNSKDSEKAIKYAYDFINKNLK